MYNIDPNATPLVEYGIDPGTVNYSPLMPELAAQRADRAQYALAWTPEQEIRNSLELGDEPILRDKAAANVSLSRKLQRDRFVINFAKQRQGKLTPEETTFLEGVFDKAVVAADPDTVLEEEFAKRRVFELDKASKEKSFLTSAQAEIPEELAIERSKASALNTKLEYARTKSENAFQTLHNQSYLGYGLDFLKNLIPFYQDVKLRGLVEGVSAAAGLTGSNIDAQIDHLLNLPFPEFKKTMDTIMTKLEADNPQLAVSWAQSVLGRSTADTFLQNAFPIIDLAGLPVFGATRAGLRKLGLINNTRKAMQDVTAAAAVTDLPSRVVLPAAAGDLAQAGAVKEALKIVNDARGTSDVAKEAIEALPAHFDTMAGQAKSAPGKYGADMGNRIAENLHRLKDNVTRIIAETARVERLPVSAAAEVVIKKTWEQIRGLYTRLNDGIIGISAPRKVPATNTYHVDMQIGRLNGELFSSELEAEGFAKLYGLPTARPAQLMQEVSERGFKTETGVTRGTDTGPRTIYVDEDLKPTGRYRAVEKPDGTVAIETFDKARKRYVAGPAVKFSTTPEVGKFAIELKGEPLDLISKKGYTDIGSLGKVSELTSVPAKGADGKIVQQGVGWYLNYTRPFKETDDIVRDFLIATNAARAPESWSNLWTSWFAKFRTPEDLLSEENRMNRKIATYAPSKFLEVAKENTEEIRKLASWALPGTQKKRIWQEWRRVIEDAKRIKDPVTGEDGYFFKTPLELEDHYMRYIKRPPSEQEVAAYFAYVANHELDLVLRNMAMYRNKIREGAELHRFHRVLEDGSRVYSDYFDGVMQKHFPGGDKTVLFSGERGGDQKIYTAGRFGKDRKELEKGVKEGRYSVIKVLAPETRPLQNMETVGDVRVNYIITPNIESKPIPFQQINRRGGGHFEYDYNFYIKQPKIVTEKLAGISRQIYEGDTTIMPISLRAMGRDVADKLNQIRLLIKDGNLDAAKAYADRNLAAIEWKELHGWFKDSFKEDGVRVPARLSLDEPIQVAERNKLLIDSDPSIRNRANMHDGTKESFMDRVQFAGERDAWEMFTLRDKGTRYNPLYAREDVKFVDPITSMDRALTRIIHSTFLEDYKIMSIEHWLRQAGDPKTGVLKATEADIRAAPYYFFHTASEHYLSNADPARVRLFEAQRFQILQLLGTPSKWETFLQSGAQKLSDMVHKNISPKALNYPLLDPVNVIPKLADPARFFRSMTFHAKLGMFNPAQLLVQSQTYATIAGVAGLRYAIPGTKAAALHMYSRVNKNPAILDALDKLASTKIIPGTAVWKPGQFKEAMQLGERTGFFNVAGEFALRDEALTPQVIQHGGKQFLDAGAIFFTLGEKNVRNGAWYTAYLRFRKANPTGRITDTDLRKILNDADMLSVNMSRASSSMLHTGIMSIPSQFLSYQIRMAELFFSKRLGATASERAMARARILAYNSVLYGAPTSLGVTGFPIGDIIRKYALENGYTFGDSYYTSMMEGLPSLLTAYATGVGELSDFRGRTRTGNYYNYGDRFGVQGFETIREAMMKDNWWLSLVTGAAGSTVGGVIESSHPFYAYLMGKIKDGNEGNFRTEDLIRPFREISSINTAARYIALLNTGKWESKKGAQLTEETVASGSWMSVLGLQPQEVADMSIRAWSNKDLKDTEKKAFAKFNDEWQRGLVAGANNNPKQADEHFSNAIWMLRLAGYPEHKIGEAYASANRRGGVLTERVLWQNLIRDVPEDQREVREESFIKKQEIKKEREKAR